MKPSEIQGWVHQVDEQTGRTILLAWDATHYGVYWDCSAPDTSLATLVISAGIRRVKGLNFYLLAADLLRVRIQRAGMR